MQQININMSSRKASVRDLPLALSFVKEEKQPCFTKQAEDPGYARAASTGMTNIFKRGSSGFTLIELLVVVLIIGILAAVALPQYTLSVNKSRFANLQTTAQPYVKAAEMYYISNGIYPTNFDEISVAPPAGFTTVSPRANFQCTYNEDVYCCITRAQGDWKNSISCGRRDYSFIYFYYLSDNQSHCMAEKNNAQAVKLCQSLGGTYRKTAGVLTPNGTTSSSHKYYLLP